MWAFPILLVIPNIVLCFTEGYGIAGIVANLMLPFGVYTLLCSWSRNIGRTVWLCLPLSIYAAFQIVLTFLYGESIIAIDMFLNVATTNFGEATELLANLGTAICVVVVLYLPPLVWGAALMRAHRHTARSPRRTARKVGAMATVIGVVATIAACASSRGYSPTRHIFPINVISNTAGAVTRYHDTQAYKDTSAAFRFNSRSAHAPGENEVYVLIVGETCRADNWQLLGYERPTNPSLYGRTDIIACPRALSESNTTHKSVPLMLSPLSAETFGDSIYFVRSIFDAFNEAGFHTAFISNQQRNGSFIDFFDEQADTCHFIADDPRAERNDMHLLALLRRQLSDAGSGKQFIVLHSYGSHFSYKERYEPCFRKFTPDHDDNASRGNRAQLINAYDNSIVATDSLIAGVINSLSALPDSVSAALMFVPDHGEDIFDDDRERFLHASPNPTYWQIHVPIVMWMSEHYRTRHPLEYTAALNNSHRNISSSRSVFDTLLSLAGICTDHSRPWRALTDTAYREEPRVYLNDYNEGIRLKFSGMHTEDFEMFRNKDICVE